MKKIKVAVLCEFSGIVRDAFISQGCDAISCDIRESERPGRPHYKGSCFDKDWTSYDLVIAHPPCTDLAVSGARWFPEKRKNGSQQRSIEFFMWFTQFKRFAIENPISIMSTEYRKPDVIIQPWQFGHGETKATCLWLQGVPKLMPTNVVEGREHRVHRMAPGPERDRERSRTYQGIADAMAQQWTAYLKEVLK